MASVRIEPALAHRHLGRTRGESFRAFLFAFSAAVSVCFSEDSLMAASLNGSEDSLLSISGSLRKSKAVPGYTMPKLDFFKVLDCSPEEAAATYFDVENHPSYFKDIVRSRIDSTLSPSEIILRFKQHLFLWFYDESRVRNEFSKSGEEYLLAWSIIHSEGAKSGKGLISFTPFGSKTLMQYTVLVQPSSFFMKFPLIRSIAIKRMSEILDDTEKAVLAEKSASPGKLSTQIRLLAYRCGKSPV
jgi:hypothetical protein